MSNYDDSVNELYIHFSHKFRAIRVIENQIIPTEWKLKSDVYIPEGEQIDDYGLNLALLKIRFWFDQVLVSSLIFSRDNTWANMAFINDMGSNVENNLMITPYEPTDDHLALIFQSKMTALAKGTIYFSGVELHSDNARGLSFTYYGDSDKALPDNSSWIGERSYFSVPWWSRDDASTFDVLPDEDADLDETPKFAYSLDFLGEAIKPNDDKIAKILKPDFKPKIIKGKK